MKLIRFEMEYNIVELSAPIRHKQTLTVTMGKRSYCVDCEICSVLSVSSLVSSVVVAFCHDVSMLRFINDGLILDFA